MIRRLGSGALSSKGFGPKPADSFDEPRVVLEVCGVDRASRRFELSLRRAEQPRRALGVATPARQTTTGGDRQVELGG